MKELNELLEKFKHSGQAIQAAISDGDLPEEYAVRCEALKEQIFNLFESQKARYAADLAELSKENERLRDAGRYLLSFTPPWIEDVPSGLDPTFYGTCSEEGDVQVKAMVDGIKELLKEGE